MRRLQCRKLIILKWCLCLCQAWEPLHSSEGFALAGSGRHSWATQSRSLAAAGRLSQQPWPTWTLPHPNYQGNIGGGAACGHNLLFSVWRSCRSLQADAGEHASLHLTCARSPYKSVCLIHTRTSDLRLYAVVWARVCTRLCCRATQLCCTTSLHCKVAAKPSLIIRLLLTQKQCSFTTTASVRTKEADQIMALCN